MNNKWSSLKKNIAAAVSKYSGFEFLVDIIQRLIDFQILYCALLHCYFNAYQNQEAAFQPVLYTSLVVYAAFILLLEKFSGFTELWTIMLFELMAGALFVLVIPVSGTKVWIIAAIILLIVDSVWRFRYSFSEAASYSLRFRTLNRALEKGVIIVIIFLIHVISSEQKSSILPIGTNICNYYMIVSFAIFIILSIMVKYAFHFYEYYRQGKQADKRGHLQIKHTFLMILLVISVFIALAFLIFGAVLTPIIRYIFRIIISLILELIFGNKLELKNEDAASSDQGFGSNAAAISAERVTRDKSPIFDMIPYLVVMIVIFAVVYMLWKLYKNILANYKIETDEAEFIPFKEENELYVEKREKRNIIKFGKSNKEKIRKYYFSVISKRAKKKNAIIKKTQTPKELASILSDGKERKQLMDELTEIYEKARYSNNNCSEEEVEKIKELHEKL